MSIQSAINQTISLAALVASQSPAAQRQKMQKQAEVEAATHQRDKERKLGELTSDYEAKKSIAEKGRGYKSIPDLQSQLQAGEKLYEHAPTTELSEANKATRQEIARLSTAHEKALRKKEQKQADEAYRQEVNREAAAQRSAESERIRNLIIERGKP